MLPRALSICPGQGFQSLTKQVKLNFLATFRGFMLLRRLMLSILLIPVCSLLSGCSNQPAKPKVPTFVSYSERQKARINPVAGEFGDITGQLAAMKQQVFSGQDVHVADTVINDGAPAKGIRLVVKGSVFAEGLFGAPTKGSYSLPNDKGEGEIARGDFDMVADDAGGYVGTADVKVTNMINVGFTAPAKRGGEGVAQMFVYPADKGGTSAAAFTYPYVVRSESDDAEQTNAPD